MTFEPAPLLHLEPLSCAARCDPAVATAPRLRQGLRTSVLHALAPGEGRGRGETPCTVPVPLSPEPNPTFPPVGSIPPRPPWGRCPGSGPWAGGLQCWLPHDGGVGKAVSSAGGRGLRAGRAGVAERDPHVQPPLYGALASCFVYCGYRFSFIPKGVSLQSGCLDNRGEQGTGASGSLSSDSVSRKQTGPGAEDGPDPGPPPGPSCTLGARRSARQPHPSPPTAAASSTHCPSPSGAHTRPLLPASTSVPPRRAQLQVECPSPPLPGPLLLRSLAKSERRSQLASRPLQDTMCWALWLSWHLALGSGLEDLPRGKR